MNGFLSIDFQPREDAVARILGVIDQSGMTILGIRLIPTSAGARATLRLELWAEPHLRQLQDVERRVRALENTIDVIHLSYGTPAPGTNSRVVRRRE